MESKWRGPIGASILALIIYGVWHVTAWNEWVSDIILPAPDEVAVAFFQTLSEGFFYSHLWITTQEVLIGFAIGVIIGFGLGAMLGSSLLAREVAYPFVVAFQGLPKIVLAPVFITAFGFGMTSKVVMAAVISFFPLLVNTESGIATVDADAVKLMRSLNASKRDIFFRLALPHSLPSIFAGLKAALTFALVGAIVGEFVGAGRGLGYLLDTYSYQLQVPRVWAVTTVLALMGVILFLAIDILDRKIVFWRPSARDTQATL
ncbi:MAG: ABC transporter permease [Acidimicrobiia bacterium]|nr:ABC transporter permease [Acidimicrobiia bacterium]